MISTLSIRPMIVTCVIAAALGHAPDGFGAQQLLRVHLAQDTVGTEARRFDTAGDVNADGIPDYFIAGTITFPDFSLAGLRMLDGATGSSIWFYRFDSNRMAQHDSVDVVDDFDGDGVREICLGYEGSQLGRFRIFSGATGDVLSETQHPQFVVQRVVRSLPDINGDGVDDMVAMINGGTYAVLHGGLPPVPQYTLSYNFAQAGEYAATVEDIDGDGAGDFALPWFGAGTVVVYSGGTGSILYEIPSAGIAVVDVADRDGDGHRDFAVQGDEIAIGGETYGTVRIHRSVDGAHLQTIVADFSEDFTFGRRLDGLLGPQGDVDGDGVDDFLITNDYEVVEPTYLVAVASGATGSILRQVATADSFTGWPCPAVSTVSQLRILGDLDGDGYAEFGYSDAWFDGCGTLDRRGAVFIFSGAPGGGAVQFCPATPNSTGVPARLRPRGAPTVGSERLGFQLHDAPAGEFAQVYFGPKRVWSDVGIQVGGGRLCLGAAGIQRLDTPRRVESEGVLDFDIDFQSPQIGATWLAGTTWTCQAGFRDAAHPQGAGVSNAVWMELNER